MRHIIDILICLLILLVSVVASTAAERAVAGSWIEHSDMVPVLIGALCTIIGTLCTIVAFFMVRNLRQIDRNQSELFHRLNTLSAEFNQLRGEHQARIAMNISCGGKG